MIFPARSSDWTASAGGICFANCRKPPFALNKIRFKLSQVPEEKLQYTMLAKSQLARGFGNEPSITIVRNGTKGVEHLVAKEESELQPGDVVEVALRDDTSLDESGSRNALHLHGATPSFFSRGSRTLATMPGKRLRRLHKKNAIAAFQMTRVAAAPIAAPANPNAPISTALATALAIVME